MQTEKRRNNIEQNNQGYQPQQTQYQQPQYQQPVYQAPQPMYQPYDKTTSVMSVGEYIGMFILNMIPVVNIICWIVWLVSANTNKNKKNFIIASLVLSLICIVLSVVGVVLMTAVFGVSLDSIGNYM